MKYLQKIKQVMTEYWEIFLGFLVLLVGIVIGTSGSREKVLKSDLKAKEHARKKVIKETTEAVEKNQNAIRRAEEEKKEKEEKADVAKAKRKKELLKDPDKLDNILKEKYNLKGE